MYPDEFDEIPGQLGLTSNERPQKKMDGKMAMLRGSAFKEGSRLSFEAFTSINITQFLL